MTASREDFLEAAWRIGAELCREAIWDGARCNWLGDMMEFQFGAWSVVHRSSGPDLYSGTSGTGLFLLRLDRFAPDKRIRATAAGALEQAVSRADTIPPSLRHGFYTGSLGIAYALLEGAEVLDRPDWRVKAWALIDEMCSTDPDPGGLDVLAGIAGAVPFLLRLYKCEHRENLLDSAVRLGESLLLRANKSDKGWSWTTMPPMVAAAPDLTGFSHGTGGIGWTMLELHHATGRDDFRQAGVEAIRYEQFWFQADIENWPDFRGEPTPSHNGTMRHICATAWCHGAPGIGLARLRAFLLLADPDYRSQAEAAIRTTVRSINASPAQDNYSLCHGLGGNAELLIFADAVLPSNGYYEIAATVGRRGIELYDRASMPWPSGITGGGFNPSLMLGTAGVGHFFLRLHDPASVDSVLILTPERIGQPQSDRTA
ncbi:MAG: hypothetical protein JO336_24210 [Acidobacteriia bacterium]|nr:hypothetical protein [Terriglobia bacterium]